mmetsp:Transcript_24451/g.76666  ORF Transcript_24451/g.76666 Transcript_24451/m.76666 type:complete len:216 (-) Transcript_24451:840-1487(-)
MPSFASFSMSRALRAASSSAACTSSTVRARRSSVARCRTSMLSANMAAMSSRHTARSACRLRRALPSPKNPRACSMCRWNAASRWRLASRSSTLGDDISKMVALDDLSTCRQFSRNSKTRSSLSRSACFSMFVVARTANRRAPVPVQVSALRFFFDAFLRTARGGSDGALVSSSMPFGLANSRACSSSSCALRTSSSSAKVSPGPPSGRPRAMSG